VDAEPEPVHMTTGWPRENPNPLDDLPAIAPFVLGVGVVVAVAWVLWGRRRARAAAQQVRMSQVRARHAAARTGASTS
jgi:hypothetical protein